MKTSILMLTHNRPDAVQICLDSLLQTLQENDCELLILDNGSVGDTQHVVQGFQRQWQNLDIPGRREDVWVHLGEENLGVAAGRQFLIERAKGDVMIFLDSDVTIMSSRWIGEIHRALEPENVGIAGIAGSFINWSQEGRFSPCLYGTCDVVSGWCLAFKREVIEAGVRMRVEEFPHFWCEDSAMCLDTRDAGWDVVSTGGIGVAHVPGLSGDMPGAKQAAENKLRELYQGRMLIRAEGAY